MSAEYPAIAKKFLQSLIYFIWLFMILEIFYTAVGFCKVQGFLRFFFSVQLLRTVMKSGPEIVKAGLRQFFESAADDIEKMVENLKLGKVSSRNQVRHSVRSIDSLTSSSSNI